MIDLENTNPPALKTSIPLILFHGTSARRFALIMHAGTINPGFSGNRHVSLTPSFGVACVWADSASSCSDYEEGLPIVLSIDARGLIYRGFPDIEPFSDPVWGEGECDWEQEVACHGPIETDFIISVTSNILNKKEMDAVVKAGKGASACEF